MHFCVFITQNISGCFFLAPAAVINYNMVYTTYWLAMSRQKICILGHVKCYWDSYNGNIVHFAHFYYGKYFPVPFFGPSHTHKL